MPISILPVLTEGEMEDVFRLRYRAYRTINAIPESEEQRFTDEYDLLANTICFALVRGTKLLGSIRLLTSACGGKNLTAYLAFPDSIQLSFCEYTRIIEANRFVVDPAWETGKEFRCQFYLFKALIAVSLAFDAEYYIGAVRGNHIPFYQRVVFMEPISQPAVYPGLSVQMTLLGGHFLTNYRKVLDRWGSTLEVDQQMVSSIKKILAKKQDGFVA